MSGRFAPSPTGPLHLGNLRTALVAWLAARAAGRAFIVRMEDLDRATASPEHERRQLEELAALGLDWDGEVVRQSERFGRYRAAIATLEGLGLVYPCYCTRREIRAEIDAAASAPHAPPGGLAPDGGYPGTCRALDARGRAAREAAGRVPALRLRAGREVLAFTELSGEAFTGVVDDVVLARADGVPAYNLAVVVDDAAQGVTQVVRGDDLRSSTPRQLLLQRLLGLGAPAYLHVPLVLGPDGQRLAKRHGAVTLEELAGCGIDVQTVRRALLRSLGLPDALDAAVARFDPTTLPAAPVAVADLVRGAAG